MKRRSSSFRGWGRYSLALLLALVSLCGPTGCGDSSTPALDGQETVPASSVSVTSTTGIPRLLDLGAGKCIPCKMMAPILDELKEEYAGSLEVDFIDVWKNEDAGEKYGLQSIPTQIFYDSAGKELFRHEGFFGKEDILAKWRELGHTLVKSPSAASSAADGQRGGTGS